MFEIKNPAQKTYFVAHGPDATHIGTTEPGLVTVSGQPNFEQDVDPEAFASKVEGASLVSALDLIPAEGEWVEKDHLYNWNGKAVVAYQGHWRTIYPPDETPALFGLAKAAGDPWVQPAGAHDAYQVGDLVTHNGQTWENNTPDNVWEPGVFGWDVV